MLEIDGLEFKLYLAAYIFYLMGFPGGSVVKNPTAKQEMQVQSLGWEDPLEKELATHSSILGWEIPWTEEPGELQSMGSQGAGYNCTTEHIHINVIIIEILMTNYLPGIHKIAQVCPI